MKISKIVHLLALFLTVQSEHFAVKWQLVCEAMLGPTAVHFEDIRIWYSCSVKLHTVAQLAYIAR